MAKAISFKGGEQNRRYVNLAARTGGAVLRLAALHLQEAGQHARRCIEAAALALTPRILRYPDLDSKGLVFSTLALCRAAFASILSTDLWEKDNNSKY
jgi:hypothetical protein